MSKYIPITEQVRRAILASGKTRYQIFKETGITQPILSRFIHGERGLSMESLDAIGQCLGLTVQTVRKPKGKGRIKKGR